MFASPLRACVVAFALTAPAVSAADPSPPPGFTALFNGKDLSGWYGWSSTEKDKTPADLAKLSPGEVWSRVNQWTADAAKHWTAENGELVNDGHGACSEGRCLPLRGASVRRLRQQQPEYDRYPP